MTQKNTKSTGWGGKREGSGRKPSYMLPDNQIKAMLQRARKKAKEEGKGIDDILIEIIYNKEAIEIKREDGSTKKIELAVPTTQRLAAIKLFKEFTMSKHVRSEKDININDNRGPRIGLPEMKKDPALSVVSGGKN